MQINTDHFQENSDQALLNHPLQTALKGMEGGLALKRQQAIAKLPEFEALRDHAVAIKDHCLAHLDLYIEAFTNRAEAAGTHVHFAHDASAANEIIQKIIKEKDAKFVTKGKSMASEEIGLNAVLEKSGVKILETDLGEYIIQLRHEAPSHILAPAIHVLQSEVEALFRDTHQTLDPNRDLALGTDLVQEARNILRTQYAKADIGITGANFLISETGQSVIVTNEGNGDLTQSSAPVHIVIAGIDKIIPKMDDVATILRLLPRSATGQTLSSYVTFSLGGRRANDADGPQEMHLILLDNGRSTMLGNEFRDMLRCIRCSACMNVCPVYRTIGGHAYGWVYPGPMGSVLTPHFVGIEKAQDLPNASSLCGRCSSVCPVKIPLHDLLRKWRKKAHDLKLNKPMQRSGLAIWAQFAARPRLYHALSAFVNFTLRLLGGKKKYLNHLPLHIPLLGARNWVKHRSLLVPNEKSFMQLYAAHQKQGKDYVPH